jgi:hypothetical protein
MGRQHYRCGKHRPGQAAPACFVAAGFQHVFMQAGMQHEIFSKSSTPNNIAF